MNVKEFLLNCDKINLVAIARAMYPSDASAPTYLKAKLNGTDGRTFTEKDAFKAVRVLHALAKEIKEVSIT